MNIVYVIDVSFGCLVDGGYIDWLIALVILS